MEEVKGSEKQQLKKSRDQHGKDNHGLDLKNDPIRSYPDYISRVNLHNNTEFEKEAGGATTVNCPESRPALYKKALQQGGMGSLYFPSATPPVGDVR